MFPIRFLFDQSVRSGLCAFLVAAALHLSVAFANATSDPLICFSGATLAHHADGWVVIKAALSTDAGSLHERDLIVQIDHSPAASVAPLTFVNLIDESFARKIEMEVRRDGRSILINLRKNRHENPQTPPLMSPEVASNEWFAPNFTVQDVAGKRIHLSDEKGRWVLLSFGASWCGPCVAEIPSLNRLASNYKGRLSIVLLAIHDKEGALRALIAKQAISYRVASVGGVYADIPVHYGVSSPHGGCSVPVSVLLRPDGSIAYAQVGGSDPNLIYHAVDQFLSSH